jgi:hypothetical protein
MGVKLTVVVIDLTSVNAWRMIFIEPPLSLVRKATKERLAQTISPILKILGLVLTILQELVSILFCILMNNYLPCDPIIVFLFF